MSKLTDLFNFWSALGRPKQLGIEGGQLTIEGLGGVDLGGLLDEDAREDRARASGSALPPARNRPRELFSVGTVGESSRADVPEVVDPKLAEKLAQADERNRKAAEREARADAREFLGLHRRAGRINKAGADRFEAAYLVAALDDEQHPIVGYKRVEALRFLVETRPKSPLLDDENQGDLVGDEDISLRPGEKALNNGPDNSPPPAEIAKEKRFRLHSTSPSGMQFLRNDPEGREWLKKNGLS